MKNEEDILKFTNSIILLAKLLVKIEDRFFAQKLHGKIFDLVSAFITTQHLNSQSTAAQRTNVSHNIGKKNLINAINNSLDCLEYLARDSKSDTTPLFLAQKNLLKFKLHILKQNQTTKLPENKVEEKGTVASEINLKPIFKHKTTRLILKSDSNKEKIFNFVKRFPDARTKEIIDKFSALSGRTVKRNLKELTDGGFLKKKLENGAVYYFENT